MNLSQFVVLFAAYTILMLVLNRFAPLHYGKQFCWTTFGITWGGPIAVLGTLSLLATLLAAMGA